ncbi:MAG: hypothetical protein K2Y01_00990 [Rhabdochlamydiaceae bacterium]|nr:hypothetical protein [Rhabdochlamydiaceae bacterium]
MNPKLKIIASSWEEKAKTFRSSHPLKVLKTLPNMEGITSDTAKNLKAKGLWYLLRHDPRKIFLRNFFKHPFRYTASLLRSYRKPCSFSRAGDCFFYGIENEKEFEQIASKQNPLILLGFSYCHKPFECPSGRFSDQCQNTPDHPVCSQCFIGKCSALAAHTQAEVVYIPTIHYIGEKIFEATHKNPGRQVLFLITACELSLTMFGDWGNMIQAKGIGIRLDGRICNTMRAFELSEHGIKPGLTVVLKETEQKLLDLISLFPE